MPNIKIRPATISDAPQLAKVHVHGWQTTYIGLMPQDYLASLSIEERTKTWTKNLTKSDIRTITIVAEIDDQIVGFCSVGPSRDVDKTDQAGEIRAIYVLKEYQGQGIGKLLHQAGLKYLHDQGFTQATLWVLDTNTKTRMWYEKNGWILEGQTKTDNRQSFSLSEIRYKIDLQK